MKDKQEKFLKLFLGIAIVAVIVYLFVRYGSSLRRLKFKEVRSYILSYGKFASICFVIIYSLKPIVFIVPASLLSIAAGNIFGPYIALLLSMISCFFAGTLAFFLAKYFGRGFVQKMLKGKVLTLDDNIEKHGFKIMLLMRLSFVFSYDALSYGGGLTKMKYKDFIFGTLLGVLPEMTAYSFMGKNIAHPFSMKFILPIVLIIIMAICCSYIYKAYNKSLHK
jgi:uncharacterized membrane protein YdjX (TVP38/TMEM64 family)